MKRVLAVLVALLWWCPTAFPQELANLRIAVDAEPGTPRTEALVALLRTRFTRVDVGDPAEADVVVLDRWEGNAERRPERYGWSDWPRPDKPYVVLGGAARGAIPAWNLLGARPGAPMHGPTERRDPGAARPGPELTEPVFAGGYAALAFALFEAPDAHVALSTRDEDGRPLALVWHQGRFVFFGPGAAADELGKEWREVLLRCVAYAGGFYPWYGDVVSEGAPGADGRGELAWRLDGASPNGAGWEALVSDPHAPRFDDLEEWRAWFSRRGLYLVADDSGRLYSDDGLLAFGAVPSHPDFLERVVANLSAASAEDRATARRLLERHLEGAPNVYASRAEWDAWVAEERRSLVYCPSDQRWRLKSWDASGSDLSAWELASGFCEGGRVFHAADPRLAAHVPGSDGPPSLLRVPYIWSLPPEAAADALMRWLQQTEDVAERELVLRNMAELGPDAALLAGSVAAWFQGASPELVVRVIASAGPAAFEDFLEAAKLAEGVARATPMPYVDLATPVDVLVRHPAVDGAFLGRLAATAAALPEGQWPQLTEALLGGVARGGARPDPSWSDPLFELVARHGPLHTPNLMRALARHGDSRWVPEVRRRLEALEEQGHELPAEQVAEVAGLGAPGLDLLLEFSAKGTPKWRSNLAHNVDLDVLAAHRPPRDWFALEAGTELILRALVAQWTTPRAWRDALLEAATNADDRTAVPLLDAASSVLSRERSWPLLERALAHPSIWRRRAAAHGIASFHPGAEYTRDAWLAASHDADAWVQATALWALREPLGERDAKVLARLREVAASSFPLAAVARHSLYRRTISNTPILDAVHSWRDAIRTPPSDHVEDIRSKRHWEAALRAAEVGNGDEERSRWAEHKLSGWIAGLWDWRIVFDEDRSGASTRLLVRLGEAALFELERTRPFVDHANAFAFGEHAVVVRSMELAGWPLLAAMIWSVHLHLDTPIFDWPSVPGASAWLATMLAQRESHEVAVDAGIDLDLSTDRWKSLGEAGRAALRELEQHPSAAVREHARDVLARLGE